MGQKETVKEIRSDLEEEIDIEALYLFGSRARGTFDQHSDLDLAVVSTFFEGMNSTERYNAVIDTVRRHTGETPVDVICYTPEEFENGSDSFLPSVIRDEGISV